MLEKKKIKMKHTHCYEIINANSYEIKITYRLKFTELLNLNLFFKQRVWGGFNFTYIKVIH